jgi:L-asparaginase/Glu-tRNA(Gln) amidotransferase subunit D
MNRSRSVSAVLFAVAFGASCQNSFGQGKANIVILATGGTIAGAAATRHAVRLYLGSGDD